ncbi:hypothetical protein LAC02_52030 [Ligilactobacillus acidipiscis]|nr:hypothetical protein LAC02_52030 [Ligilactobacillus acidipiscis]
MILRACSADSFAILSLNRYIRDANGAMKYLTDLGVQQDSEWGKLAPK